MGRVVLDTDLFSECIKGKNQSVYNYYAAYVAAHSRLTITSLSVFEVLSGIYHRLPNKAAQYEHLLREVDEIIPDGEDYRLAAKIDGALLQVGKPIGKIDPLIAACALCRNLPLATGNTKHYQSIADVGFPLELENWRGEAPT